MSRRIVFIGAGNMAEALVRGLVQRGGFRPADIAVTDPLPARLEYLGREFGVGGATDNRGAVEGADVVVLAVKPQVMGAVLADLYEAFMEVPDFHTLFEDHVHPNDAGYEIIANVLFEAISTPPATSSGSPWPAGAAGTTPTAEPILPRRPPWSRGPFRR